MKVNMWVVLAIFSLASMGLWLGSFLPVLLHGAEDIGIIRDVSAITDNENIFVVLGGNLERIVRVVEGVASATHFIPTPERMEVELFRLTLIFQPLRAMTVITEDGWLFSIDKQVSPGSNVYSVLDPRDGAGGCLREYSMHRATGVLSTAPTKTTCGVNVTNNTAYQAAVVAADEAGDDSGHRVVTLPMFISTFSAGSHRIKKFAVRTHALVPEAAPHDTTNTTRAVLIFDYVADRFSTFLPQREHHHLIVSEVATGNVMATSSRMTTSRLYAIGDLGVPGVEQARARLTSTELAQTQQELSIDGGDRIVEWRDTFVDPEVPSVSGALRIIRIVDIGALNRPYRVSVTGVVVACTIAFITVIVLQVTFSYIITNGSNELDAVVSQMEHATEDFSLKELNEEQQRQQHSILSEIAEVQSKFSGVQRAINITSVFIPKEVVTSVLISGRMSMEVTPLECAIIFVDIDNFLQICDELSVDAFADVTGRYFEVQTATIIRNGGTIDKFMGDCIMAMWGAPLPIDNKRIRALTTALQLRDGIQQREHTSFFEEHGTNIGVRVGVHAGTVAAGNVGCDARVSYTILGDPVNFTARLQSANRHLGTRILVSDDATLEVPEGFFAFRPMGRLRVVGKNDSIGANELVGLHPTLDLKAFRELSEDTDGFSIAATSINATDAESRSEQSHRSRGSGKYKRGSVAVSQSNRSASASHTASHTGSRISAHSSRSSERAARLLQQRMTQINNVGKGLRVSMQFCKQCSEEDVAVAYEYASIVERYTSGAFKEAIEELRSYRQKDHGKSDMAAKLLQRQCEQFLRDPPPADWAGEFSLTSK